MALQRELKMLSYEILSPPGVQKTMNEIEKHLSRRIRMISATKGNIFINSFEVLCEIRRNLIADRYVCMYGK